MKTVDIIEGLTILQKYRDTQDGYEMGAEHDQIYAYHTDKPLSDADLARMIELGWFQENYEGDEFTAASYNAEESWTAFV